MKKNVISLTFVIGTYNRADLLDVTLREVCEQILRVHSADIQLGVIVSDNASGDHTDEVLRKFSDMYGFVRTIRQDTNIGPFSNYREAAKLAATGYLWVFGDDDILLPGALEGVVKRLSRYQVEGSELNLLLTDFVHFGAENLAYSRPRDTPPILHDVFFSARGDIFNRISFAGAGFLSRIIVKREYWLLALQDVNVFEWRVWPQVKALILAAAEGPALLCSQTCVAQRVFSRASNANWLGAATLTNGIEFPMLCSYAMSSGFHFANVHKAFDMHAALRAFFKITIFDVEFGSTAITESRKQILNARCSNRLFIWFIAGMGVFFRRPFRRILSVPKDELNKVHLYRSALEGNLSLGK